MEGSFSYIRPSIYLRLDLVYLCTAQYTRSGEHLVQPKPVVTSHRQLLPHVALVSLRHSLSEAGRAALAAPYLVCLGLNWVAQCTDY